MSEAKTESKAGRPKGATVKDRPVRNAIICVDACRACGSRNEPKNKRLLRSGDASATVNGIACGSYKHYHADCPDCGKAFLYREFKTIQ